MTTFAHLTVASEFIKDSVRFSNSSLKESQSPELKDRFFRNDAWDFLSVNWIQHTLFYGQIFQETGLCF